MSCLAELMNGMAVCSVSEICVDEENPELQCVGWRSVISHEVNQCFLGARLTPKA